MYSWRFLTVFLCGAVCAVAANSQLTKRGTGIIRGSSATSESGFEIQQGPAQDVQMDKSNGSQKQAHVPASGVPRPASSAVGAVTTSV